MITIKQSMYAKKILGQFGMLECNPTKYPMEPKIHLHKDEKGHPVDASEYRRIIRCLRYLLHTWPDLSFAVGMASRFMERPTVMHHKAVKQNLRYLKGTMHYGLVYGRGGVAEEITGFTDSDMAGDMDDRKSTSGMAFYVRSVLWLGIHRNRRQSLFHHAKLNSCQQRQQHVTHFGSGVC